MRFSVRPRWIIFSVLVVMVSVGCVMLGFWQLDRLEERRSANAVIASRLVRDPVPLGQLLEALQPQAGAESDPADYQFARVSASGVFTEEGRVLVRSQVVKGQAGVHAVFPLDLGDGTGVLVNVGWFPLGLDPPPVTSLYAPQGRIDLIGFLRADQERPALGRTEPEGRLETVARIDVSRIQRQVDLRLLPLWIHLIAPDDPDRLPVPVPQPTLDEGSHFSYAVQWFSFGLIAVIGYVALMWKQFKPSLSKRVLKNGDSSRPSDH